MAIMFAISAFWVAQFKLYCMVISYTTISRVQENKRCLFQFDYIIFNLIIGIIWGMVFYYFVKEYYLNAEKGIIEKETCELGYNNYKCAEIKNGTVILKENENNEVINLEETE